MEPAADNIKSNKIRENNVGVKLDSYCSFNKIESNNLSNNIRKGLYLINSDDNDLWYNEISDGKFGVLTSNSSNNNISGNIITESWIGLNIYNKSKRNIISKNIISNHHYGLIIGSPVLPTLSINNIIDDSNFNKIIKNNFCKNI